MVAVLGEAEDLHSRVGGNQQTVYKSSFTRRIYPAIIHYALGHIQYTKYNMTHTISNIMISNKSVTSPCSKLENMAAWKCLIDYKS